MLNTLKQIGNAFWNGHDQRELTAFKTFADKLLEFTPDSNNLDWLNSDFLFVVDESMAGMPKNFQLTSEAEHKYAAFTRDPLFTLWMKGDKKDCVVVPMRAPSHRSSICPVGRIKGQLWKVPTNVLYFLDREKENGVKYRRQKVFLTVPCRESGFEPGYGPEHPDELRWINVSHARLVDVRAWMYVGIRTYWDEYITAYDGFRPVRRFNPKGFWTERPYYCLTSLEFNE